jgi:hypothetical protein
VFWPVLVVYWLILVFLTMRRQIQSMIKYRYVFREEKKKEPQRGHVSGLRGWFTDSFT